MAWNTREMVWNPRELQMNPGNSRAYFASTGIKWESTASWQESLKCLSSFVIFLPILPPMFHAQQLQLLWEQWQRREEQLMLFSLFFKTIDLSNCCQYSSLGGAVYTCSCNVLRGLAWMDKQLLLIAAKPDYVECWFLLQIKALFISSHLSHCWVSWVGYIKHNRQ